MVLVSWDIAKGLPTSSSETTLYPGAVSNHQWRLHWPERGVYVSLCLEKDAIDSTSNHNFTYKSF